MFRGKELLLTQRIYCVATARWADINVPQFPERKTLKCKLGDQFSRLDIKLRIVAIEAAAEGVAAAASLKKASSFFIIRTCGRLGEAERGGVWNLTPCRISKTYPIVLYSLHADDVNILLTLFSFSWSCPYMTIASLSSHSTPW